MNRILGAPVASLCLLAAALPAGAASFAGGPARRRMSWHQAATTRSVLADLLTKTQSPGSNGLGVSCREPEAYPGWQGYTTGAVNASGQFTAAPSAF